MTNSLSMFRLLASFWVALALFFSPLAMMGDGGAMAHAPSVEMAAVDDHCSGANDASEEQNSDAMLDCMSMCSAMAASAQAFSETAAFTPVAVVALPPPFPGGILPEKETPPPRFS